MLRSQKSSTPQPGLGRPDYQVGCGHGGKVGVRLTHLGQALIIEVDDDGVGGAQVGTGLGLTGLADRIDALGGRLRIESPAGGGSHIVAELPCES